VPGTKDSKGKLDRIDRIFRIFISSAAKGCDGINPENLVDPVFKVA
jgi:hypothetical protein